MHPDPFLSLFLLMGSAVGVVALFRQFGLSPILGYLALGVLIGPQGLGWLPDNEQTRFLAELGVVFLMFLIGLEFTLPELLANRRNVLGLGGSEVILVTLLAGLGAWLAGMDYKVAILLGGAVAMSSTAVVIKQLAEQMELATRHGRMAVSVLLFQDLATVPFLILLGTLTATEGSESMGLVFLKAGVVFGGLYLAGRWLARPFLHWVARGRSGEVFMLAAIFIVVSAAMVAHEAGLSPPLGAFLAGMVLGETEFRHQVESDIRPFQEILLGLFFATIGMLLAPQSLLLYLPQILLLTIIILLAKASLIALLVRGLGEDWLTALRSGITLAQAGEFGLLLVAGVLGQGLLDEQDGQILLGAMVLSIAATPLLIRYNQEIARWLLRRQGAQRLITPEQAIRQEVQDLEQPVIIVGFGRIGQNLATLLQQDQFDYLALDLDAERVRTAREAGYQVVYGDATHHSVLEAAGVERAAALVLTHDQLAAARQTTRLARQHNPTLTILARTREDEAIDQLLDAGASEVLPEGLESSLMLGAQLLILLGRPASEVDERMAEIRADRYQSLRHFIHSEHEGVSERHYQRRLETVPIVSSSRAIGQRLGDLSLPARVAAIRRQGILVPSPGDQTRLREGDILILSGEQDELDEARRQLLSE